MGITFNANEIFEMAEEVERNGAKFYREAAQQAKDDKTKQMLLDMAVMEDGHFQTFQDMRKELSPREKEPPIFDPDNQAAMYLQTMADGRGYEGKISLTDKLTGSESIEDIFNIAIDAEKNSVVFYSGLKEMVPAKAGKEKVEAIIKEELGHLAMLKLSLSALK
jgi:rubrerythrin